VLQFFVVTCSFFLIILGRFFLVAGLFHLYFYVLGKEKWEKRKVTSRKHEKGQFRKELGWSMLSACIFSATAALMYFAWRAGWTRLYMGNEYPWWWIPLSLGSIFFLHETYYYWVHRWMHKPAIFRRVHRVHHESKVTSPWTAFSFHPLEAILQALIIPVLIMIIPLHVYALLFMLVFMTFSSVVNHLGIEIYPRWFLRSWPTKWLIGATHHSLHHNKSKYNYGLYFTFWDQWGKTERKNGT
jgi:sterol desaturase/sphingolipid hydroxylase (fatty acid hydroxylase superfamily)